MRNTLQLPETESLKLKWIGSSLNSYHLSGLSTMYVHKENFNQSFIIIFDS